MRQRALAPQHFATELGFEGLDRAAQGRLSDVASLCCLGQIQSFADSQEISNLVHLQGTAPHYPFMAGSGNLTAAMVPSGANLIMLKCVDSGATRNMLVTKPERPAKERQPRHTTPERKSTRLNSSH